MLVKQHLSWNASIFHSSRDRTLVNVHLSAHFAQEKRRSGNKTGQNPDARRRSRARIVGVVQPTSFDAVVEKSRRFLRSLAELTWSLAPVLWLLC